MQAGPTNVVVGDPITVKIKLIGKGALDTLVLPPFEEGANFKAFALTNRVAATDLLGLEGEKRFEFVLAPQNTEVKALPAYRFSYFNPEQRTYCTLEQPPLPIIVRATTVAGTMPVLPGSSNARESAPVVQDIANIKTRLGLISAVGPPRALRPVFVAVQVAPVLAWLAVIFWLRYQENLNRNPRCGSGKSRA